nr:succinate dehydrogenase subunit 3 [Pulsatilla chinensis]YP_010542219.1 succinate dehydrogenase subunit 3 [Pulsatilla cernua]YP_010690192.1 succinate dehydrogenase subunit 3 [Pulsatilla dahurica]UYG19708.1 succinate dehydrogenase subunit 3 [Pulsatilla chinensis var. kissii]UYG19645.1 succinate dehydrogenase subunit 3 [Pulsatilla chinensis]UYG19680.1 succinate dehydrogenase subunit 3 [Pulsatilla cernua]WBU13031.1 succinate dehydrogenase subunit 3 [Pulsatilla dahurica]
MNLLRPLSPHLPIYKPQLTRLSLFGERLQSQASD